MTVRRPHTDPLLDSGDGIHRHKPIVAKRKKSQEVTHKVPSTQQPSQLRKTLKGNIRHVTAI